MKKITSIFLFGVLFISCNGKKTTEPVKPTISATATAKEKVEFYAKNSQDKDTIQSVQINGLDGEIANIKYNQSLWHSEDVYLKELCYVYPPVTRDIFENCTEIQTITFWFMIEDATAVRFDFTRETYSKISDIEYYKVQATLDYNKFIDSVDSIYIHPLIKTKLTKLTSRRKTN